MRNRRREAAFQALVLITLMSAAVLSAPGRDGPPAPTQVAASVAAR